MPLPDANNYSTRIYELLKETDLQNLSYSQFQQTAETLFIEPENEDEMRRLVLVQLARMAVRGDWDGFLTGGGAATVDSLVAGTNITLSPVTGLGDVTINAAASPVTSLVAGTNVTLSPISGLGDVTINASGGSGAGEYGVGAVMATSNDLFVAGDAPPFGGAGAGSPATLATNNVMCYPFIAAKSGNVSSLSVRVQTGATNDLLIQICADSGTGYPTGLVGNVFEIDCSVAGVISDTAIVTTTLVQGTKYWMCYCWGSAYSGGSPSVYIHNTGASSGWTNGLTYSAKLSIIDVGSTNSLPATMSTSGYTSGYNQKVRIGIEYT